MSGMIFDPELLRLWDPSMLAAGPMPTGGDLARLGAAAPPATALPPPQSPPVAPQGPPATPPPRPGDADANAGAAPPGTAPEPAAEAPTQDLLTRLGLTGGGEQGRRPVDVPAFLRSLAGMLRPPAAAVPRPVAQAAPPSHRPQGGALPMRQATPGNPYLQAATPSAPQRPRRRGLLDHG